MDWTPGGMSSDVEDRRGSSGGGGGFGFGGGGGLGIVGVLVMIDGGSFWVCEFWGPDCGGASNPPFAVRLQRMGHPASMVRPPGFYGSATRLLRMATGGWVGVIALGHLCRGKQRMRGGYAL